jgi:4-hydroxy-3-methylbut-2-enyl diphosphate reductase IspH
VASETEQELQRYLEGVHFAANTEDLISIAMSNGAPEELIEQLEDLPSKEFSNLEEVAEAMEDLREDLR